jgi:Predicted AAA-ATPase/PD-(D/E)XK nuclease superfamily
MQKLPIGIHTFRRLREDNCVYVDKTEYAYNLITRGYRYFLARPRRFGKSLFVSTLSEILHGNKQLFNDLWITQSDYQWKPHGVIQLDFSGIAGQTVEQFENGLKHVLVEIAQQYKLNIDITSDRPDLILRNLIKTLRENFNHVALLVDEYDSPILRALTDLDRAQKIRTAIQAFFTTIKSLDADIDFVFITGVSSFAKAGLFSGINNLEILTLDPQYAAICGYTDHEIDHNFKEHINAWGQRNNISYADLRKEIKAWYNGYSFGHNVPSVYNPFSVMNAFNKQIFHNFWFESGMPTFLVEILKKEYASFDPEKLEVTASALGNFDVGSTPLMALMFQTGYLTIKDYSPERKRYMLDYPNEEVKDSLQIYLLEVFAHINHSRAEYVTGQLYDAFANGDIKEIIAVIKTLFAHVPYQLHMSEEKFYHALLQMACTAAGIKAQSEYSTSHGRIDLVFDLPNMIYIVEIKFNQSAENALEQIKIRRYYEPFLVQQKPITLLGLSFKREPSNFDVSYAIEQLTIQ